MIVIGWIGGEKRRRSDRHGGAERGGEMEGSRERQREREREREREIVGLGLRARKYQQKPS